MINNLNEKIEWNAFQKDLLNKTEIGKYILCESREEDSTRLFIHRFSVASNLVTKDGWWDTFTITKTPCKKGMWICSIINFKIDRNGYLNVIVNPEKYLGETIDEDSAAWDYFFKTGLFSSEYFISGRYYRFNVEHLRSLVDTEIQPLVLAEKACLGENYISSARLYDKYIFGKFMNDEFSLEYIANALDEKDSWEKLAEDLTKNISSGTDKYAEYPLIVSKLPKNKWNYYTTECTEEWLNRKFWEYDSLKLGEEKDVLNRVSAVLEYYEEKKRKEKEERKAKRKAKKENL